MAVKKKYQNPDSAKQLITTVSAGIKTPLLEVKFCSLVRPFYYPNSLKIPRYSVTCMVDPELHSEFLDVVHKIEKNEKVESFMKNDLRKGEEDKYLKTGKVLMKFQCRDKIPVFCVDDQANPEGTEMELEDELSPGENVIVIFDILRYTKKNMATVQHGLSFKPCKLYYYPASKKQGK